ncbi:MAG: hypothetical protein XD84_1345 [Desulfotomaculum sp. 46_80]|nr:MAG: hypothetical protein XD84_1345 [Desulfotomaculum sp. 46_80]
MNTRRVNIDDFIFGGVLSAAMLAYLVYCLIKAEVL